jgi:hypothetical protein
MKEETVGDAAAEYANKKYATDKGYPEEDWYISWLSFREGAKWQEAKMYSEEDMIEFAKFSQTDEHELRSVNVGLLNEFKKQ